MKYKVEDKVRIKSIDWYNENKDEYGCIACGDYNFVSHMAKFCGKVITIKEVYHNFYTSTDPKTDFYWTDEMIEGLVEEETKPKYEDEVSGEYYSTPKYLVRPSGYQFVDENGNVINAMKIVLEKKKKEYPKTYEECYQVAGLSKTSDIYGYKNGLLFEFQKLLIARDAYWKLYGEEMGLGKPWEPDWKSSKNKYTIALEEDEWCFTATVVVNCILAFPTKEMRDAFFENFKVEIESCKELL